MQLKSTTIHGRSESPSTKTKSPIITSESSTPWVSFWAQLILCELVRFCFRFTYDVGEAEGKVLCVDATIYGRHDADIHELSDLQCARDWVLPMCRHFAALLREANEASWAVGQINVLFCVTQIECWCYTGCVVWYFSNISIAIHSKLLLSLISKFPSRHFGSGSNKSGFE